jgi:dynein heavy chain, axonemal
MLSAGNVRRQCTGWNIPYQFNENDLRISLRQLRMFMDEYEEVPMDMLTYTCGECNYGGKVTDAKDRRTLMTLLSGFYNEEVLEGSYSLSQSGQYVIPPTGAYDTYLDYMASLPLVESPEVFGLHDNATISMDLAQTQDLLDTMLLTQPRHAGGGGGSSGDSTDDVIFSTASEILDKMPQHFDLEEAERKYPVMYNECMNTVLCQELGRVNVLLQQITSSLRELKKAVKGLVLLSSQLEKVITQTHSQGGTSSAS